MTMPNGAIPEWPTNVDASEVNWLVHAFERACTSLLAEPALNRGQFVIGDEEIRSAMGAASEVRRMQRAYVYHPQ